MLPPDIWLPGTRRIRALARAAVLGLTCLGLAAPPALADTMKPGKWEVSTTGDVERGGKKVPIPADTSEICISKEQAKQTTEAPPAGETGCTVETVSKTASKLVTHIVCGDVTIDNTTTWTAKSYESVIRTMSMEDGQPVANNLAAKGRYIGACTQ